MGKRKRRDKAEREARELRRIARSNASRMRQMLLDSGVQPEDIVSLNAEGTVGKRVHAVGTPENWHLTLLGCTECSWTGQAYDSVRTGDTGGEYRCPGCDRMAGGWSDSGTLDLGAISVTPPDENGRHDPTATTG